MKATTQWDAGETGCSGLIVGLRKRIEQLIPGETLEVITRNTGASIDLWVWCRMTGHRLISETATSFVVQRSES
jgi:TusA-related sulfurtransferase